MVLHGPRTIVGRPERDGTSPRRSHRRVLRGRALTAHGASARTSSAAVARTDGDTPDGTAGRSRNRRGECALRGVDPLDEHESPRLVKAKVLLELQRALARDEEEAPVERRDAHPTSAAGSSMPESLGEVRMQPADGAGDPAVLRGRTHHRAGRAPVSAASTWYRSSRCRSETRTGAGAGSSSSITRRTAASRSDVPIGAVVMQSVVLGRVDGSHLRDDGARRHRDRARAATRRMGRRGSRPESSLRSGSPSVARKGLSVVLPDLPISDDDLACSADARGRCGSDRYVVGGIGAVTLQTDSRECRRVSVTRACHWMTAVAAARIAWGKPEEARAAWSLHVAPSRGSCGRRAGSATDQDSNVPWGMFMSRQKTLRSSEQARWAPSWASPPHRGCGHLRSWFVLRAKRRSEPRCGCGTTARSSFASCPFRTVTALDGGYDIVLVTLDAAASPRRTGRRF